MTKLVKIVRKAGVLVIGIPLFIVGIILIPLPGPGILVCLLALFVLSLEFDIAKKYRDTLFAKFRQKIAEAKEKAKQRQ